MKTLPSLIFLLIFLLSGCRLGPTYKPPCTPVPEEWKQPSPPCETPPTIGFWWEVFADETLSKLEVESIQNSPTLFVALERVVEARALAGVAKSDLYPQLTINPAYSDIGQLFKIFLPNVAATDPALVSPFATIPRIFRIHQFQYFLPLNLNYELDLWGKLRGRYDSAYLNAEAQVEAWQVALLTLTTDLATSYFQLRALDTQIDVLNATLEARNKNLALTQARFDKGLANAIDVSNATLEFSNVEAELYDTIRLRRLQENMIAMFVGMPASLFCLEHNPLTEPPPCIPASLPANILLQRPDIAQAERTMAAEHAMIGVAYASFFPSINLTGTLGFSSPDLREFLKWKSRYWAIGSNGAQTVFDGGRNCDNVQVAWARFEQANGNYQQQVLIAFQEVEDALNNIEQQTKQATALQRSVAAASQTNTLSLNRYKKGLVSYFDVVNSEKSELDAKRNLTSVLGVQYVSTIQLIKALGGSWNPPCE